MSKPSVGRVVHYMARGSADGVFPPVCRAAVVTEVDTYQDGEGSEGNHLGTVGLCVLNPTGMFFDRGLFNDEETKAGGTWHWPERVEE